MEISSFKKNILEKKYDRRAFLIGSSQLLLVGLLIKQMRQIQLNENEKYKLLADENRILYPLNQLAFTKLLYEDKDQITETVNIYFTQNDDEELIFNVTGISVGTWKIRNQFNLLTFPFDKQKIKISILDQIKNKTLISS